MSCRLVVRIIQVTSQMTLTTASRYRNSWSCDDLALRLPYGVC
jgi:hypothetical protein